MARAMVTVKLEGGAKLRAALKKMNPAQNLRIFTKSAGEVAQLIATNAKEVQLLKGDGPVDQLKLTNRSLRLSQSIGIDFSPLPKAIEVGTNVVYGARHEFGIGIKARPFMAPALEAVRPKIPGIVIKHWKREAGL